MVLIWCGVRLIPLLPSPVVSILQKCMPLEDYEKLNCILKEEYQRLKNIENQVKVFTHEWKRYRKHFRGP